MFGKNKKEQNDVDKYLSKKQRKAIAREERIESTARKLSKKSSIAKSRVHRKCSLFTIPIKVLS